MTSLAVNTTRFGQIEVETSDIVTFASGLAGFPQLHQFVLIQHKEGSPYRWMQSLDEGAIAFLVVDPQEVVTDYAPKMPEWAAAALNLVEDTPRLVYTIVTIPHGRPREMTINLAGPVVINGATGQAVQIVLEEDKFPIRQRVFPDDESAAA